MSVTFRGSGLDPNFAAVARGAKADIVEGGQVHQPGGSVVEMDGQVTWPDLVGIDDEAVIVTYCVERDGTVQAQDGGEPFVSAWHPLVARMAKAVLASLDQAGVQVLWPVYVTASITAVGLLAGDPHLDDDQYAPEAGVGVAAVLGQHQGPRFAQGRIDHTSRLDIAHRGQPMPLIVDTALGANVQQCRPDEIAAFIQFGQLHAGPTTAQLPADARFRQLLVLRAMTVPSQP